VATGLDYTNGASIGYCQESWMQTTVNGEELAGDRLAIVQARLRLAFQFALFHISLIVFSCEYPMGQAGLLVLAR
jgi:hypothetical protein